MATIKQIKFEAIPTGSYPAVIGAVAVVAGKFGDQVRMRFDLTGDLSGRSVSGWCSTSFGGKSKLTQWVAAALFDGGGIPESYDLNTDDLLDRRCVVTVIERTGEDGDTFNKVDAVRPARGIGGQPRPGAGGATLTQPRPAPASNGGSHPHDASPDWPGWPGGETPASFTNAGQAIAWGAAQPGAFDSVGSARLVYEQIKADHHPATAADMWRLWIETVKARQAPPPGEELELPF